MNYLHISHIDLNLLTVFDAVMAEGNVSRAAARIGLTQPAVSHALGRLRHLVDDALFVRSPGGVTPTPRARRMAAALRPALEEMAALLRQEAEFEPAASDRCFAIGMSDYAVSVLLPPLLEAMAAEAPSVRLTVRNTGHGDGQSLLEEGAVELIAGNFPDAPGHMRSERLFMEGFVCAGRAGHPAFAKSLTLKRYLALGHLQVSTSGNPFGYVDRVLADKALARDVRVTVGQFLAVPLLLAGTDLVATEPSRLFANGRHGMALSCAKPPFAIPPFRVTMDWHGSHDGDAGHVWLRGVFRRIAQTV